MSSLLPEEKHTHKQSEVYDDLSHFIQIFKKIVTQIELTAIHIQKGNQYYQLLEGVKHMANSIHPIWQKYSRDTEPLPIDPMTFHRFVCRLAEPINLHKIKYQNITNMHSISCFITCLKQIESVIKKYQEERQFARIVQLVQIIIIKFCINCEGNIKIGSQKSYQSTIGQSMKKIWPKSKQKVEIENQLSSVSSQRQDVKTVIQVKKQKIPVISQTLQDIQRRYDSLKCIDIDFPSFKTSYFQAKNNQNCYFKDCIERNSLTLKAITTYHDDFQLFLRRKELRYYRKNKRFNQSSKIKQLSNHQIPKLQKQIDRRQGIKAIKNKVSQTFDEQSLKEKIINQIKEKEEMFATGFDNNKITYKMNNVYITLGKKNVGKQTCKNNMSPTMLKKKILQTQSNNHSYTQTAENQKYSTIYLQNKLKNTSQEKIVQRLKTQLQKIPNQEKDQTNRKTIQEKIIGFVSSPIKSQAKGKYLQINCVSDCKGSTKNGLLNVGLQQKSKMVMRLKQA